MSPSPKPALVSIVIPVYSSSAMLPELMKRLSLAMAQADLNYEAILVDDCSPDNSWAVLKELKAQYGDCLKIIRLLTNRGQHNAILCGFSRVTGDIVVTMDDDLQNPPEEISKLVDAVSSGFDLAVGAYDSKKHAGHRNMLGSGVDTLQRRIFRLPRDFKLTSFRAISRKVVDQVNQMGGAFPYITAMLLSNASTYTNVPVAHHPRGHGSSNYNLRKGFSLVSNLLLNYSLYPIYFVGAICLTAFLFSVLVASATLYRTLMYGSSVPGWTSTILILTAFSSITLFVLLILLVFVVRINQQLTRTRVNYAISEINE